MSSTYHSTDLLIERGVTRVVFHATSGSTSYETIPSVPFETTGGALLIVDMVVQRHDGFRRLRDSDDEFVRSQLQQFFGYQLKMSASALCRRKQKSQG